MPVSRFCLTPLSLLIAQAFALPSLAHAQTADQILPQVIVSEPLLRAGNGSARVGGFEAAPVLQTPAALTVIDQQQLQDLQIRHVADVSRLDASLNAAYNAVGYAEQFSIRGFPLDNASSYRKDGLPIASDASIPFENKERVEILKGLSGLQAGISTPGGLIDFITKRPTSKPLRSVLLEASERGTLYGAVDLGGRFDDTRFGYRINAAAEQLRSYVKGANGERQFVSGAFDWRITPQALLQLDLDTQHKSQITAPGYQLLGGTDLPTGISARTLLNNQPWSKPVVTDNTNIGLRLSYQWNAAWSSTFAANRHQLKRDDFAAFPYGCASAGLFPGFCANGDYDVYDYQSTGEVKTLFATQALLQGQFATGTVRHALTLGLDTLRRRDEFGDCVYGTVDCAGSMANGTSNIYQPVTVPASTISTGPVLLQRKGDERSVFVQDILALSDQVSLHAGVRHTHIERVQSASAFERDYLLPSVALVVTPTPGWSVYGSWSQGLEHGGVAPLLTTNANQILDPGKSRQQELGIKAALDESWQLSAALFQITKPLEYTDSNFTYVRNGDAVHRGLELAANGKIGRALRVTLAATALQARQRNTDDPLQTDQRITNVPAFKSALNLDYALPQLNGPALNGGWSYSSSKVFSPDSIRRVDVPSYQLFNLGVRYVVATAGVATTLRANVDNVLDKFYWADASSALGGYLLPGAPRTFKISAQFDF
ncbi:iron complex outermembrane receptor protein [Actimicrobium sp. GrIS 1.19]|uniref:TonB-dependent siderophore receptor n=1 Tax=Actimicrobium sp. GrIS 1.19 TaxID=3071708 RepID=UPI002E03EC94|nr:iron complex outermembrane receptor protein [Actimicrobium sp. GrIS 1.19]